MDCQLLGLKFTVCLYEIDLFSKPRRKRRCATRKLREAPTMAINLRRRVYMGKFLLAIRDPGAVAVYSTKRVSRQSHTNNKPRKQ